MEINKSTNGFAANRRQDDIARGLGWFSLALGVAQLLMPRKLSRTIGIADHALLMRLIGLRELATGIGILTQSQPGRWFKARVAGDVIDLALLGGALTTPGTRATRLILAGAAVAGVARLDCRTSRELIRNPGANLTALRVTRSVTIDRPAEELFRFWRNFENLPRIMNHLQSVRVLDERRSHWVGKGPAKTTVEWDAEIVNEHPNEMIAWRSLPGSNVDNAGSIRFTKAPGNRGTIVKVELQYDPPGGALGAKVAKMFGEAPEKQIAVDLHRFKQLMETGEIARTEGQPVGRKSSIAPKFDELVRT
jgi:uncharacterized membrane protein